MTSPEASTSRPLRILLVSGDPLTTVGVARILRKDLEPNATIVHATDVPAELSGLDAAVVVRADAAGAIKELQGLPAIVVVGDGCGETECTALARLGVFQSLSRACATCAKEPQLAAALRWAIEHGHLVRELESARHRELQVALHDPLTGLPTLGLYRERLRQLVAQARRSGKRLAVLFVDLDGFKSVNDTWGHAAGDRLLADVSSKMAACLRETDMLARRGGDEFVVLLDGVRGPGDAARVARKLLRRVSEPSVVLGTVLRSSASIGIAEYPEHGRRPETLERHADQAMYAAKRLGGNVFCFARGREPSVSRP